jgi:hypothetical protein
MITRLIATVAAVATLSMTGAGYAENATPVLNDSNFAAWQKHLQTTPEETRFEAVPWLPSLRDGVKAARQEDKPLLLWVMNGHPLGCT